MDLDVIWTFLEDYIMRLSLPKLKIGDFAEIIILSVLIYNVIKWVKTTRAWSLMRGLVLVFAFWLLSYILNFNVILWLFVNMLSVGIMALVVLFQPEFRKALDQLGKRQMVSSLFSLGDAREKMERFSEKTAEELVRATFDLARAKTGALIVIERDESLNEFAFTGIDIDAIVTSQLLVNMFEHNTPLHDGAVIIRGNRVVSATCYLPLSDNTEISKELGTRHRAGVGISEMTDSLTIIVSEQTGRVSCAYGGELERGVDREKLRTKLNEVRKKASTESKAKWGKPKKRRKGL